jgi:hypothetical protein
MNDKICMETSIIFDSVGGNQCISLLMFTFFFLVSGSPFGDHECNVYGFHFSTGDVRGPGIVPTVQCVTAYTVCSYGLRTVGPPITEPDPS